MESTQPVRFTIPMISGIYVPIRRVQSALKAANEAAVVFFFFRKYVVAVGTYLAGGINQTRSREENDEAFHGGIARICSAAAGWPGVCTYICIYSSSLSLRAGSLAQL